MIQKYWVNEETVNPIFQKKQGEKGITRHHEGNLYFARSRVRISIGLFLSIGSVAKMVA